MGFKEIFCCCFPCMGRKNTTASPNTVKDDLTVDSTTNERSTTTGELSNGRIPEQDDIGNSSDENNSEMDKTVSDPVTITTNQKLSSTCELVPGTNSLPERYDIYEPIIELLFEVIEKVAEKELQESLDEKQCMMASGDAQGFITYKKGISWTIPIEPVKVKSGRRSSFRTILEESSHPADPRMVEIVVENVISTTVVDWDEIVPPGAILRKMMNSEETALDHLPISSDGLPSHFVETENDVTDLKSPDFVDHGTAEILSPAESDSPNNDLICDSTPDCLEVTTIDESKTQDIYESPNYDSTDDVSILQELMSEMLQILVDNERQESVQSAAEIQDEKPAVMASGDASVPKGISWTIPFERIKMTSGSVLSFRTDFEESAHPPEPEPEPDSPIVEKVVEDAITTIILDWDEMSLPTTNRRDMNCENFIDVPQKSEKIDSATFLETGSVNICNADAELEPGELFDGGDIGTTYAFDESPDPIHREPAMVETTAAGNVISTVLDWDEVIPTGSILRELVYSEEMISDDLPVSSDGLPSHYTETHNDVTDLKSLDCVDQGTAESFSPAESDSRNNNLICHSTPDYYHEASPTIESENQDIYESPNIDSCDDISVLQELISEMIQTLAENELQESQSVQSALEIQDEKPDASIAPYLKGISWTVPFERIKMKSGSRSSFRTDFEESSHPAEPERPIVEKVVEKATTTTVVDWDEMSLPTTNRRDMNCENFIDVPHKSEKIDSATFLDNGSRNISNADGELEPGEFFDRREIGTTCTLEKSSVPIHPEPAMTVERGVENVISAILDWDEVIPPGAILRKL